ncbi:hypothetical protein GOM49_17760 [Clostridium bovifaecis]|uniref:Polymer-forming cytoskeletal protein n=1 Tax=Clostridium bovifaecis TaxID=2184719 RepID=A0A6I6ESC7_9CLOT|nr:hypothetical protein GOM49_17760 [Clostridium bovifaecis]
MAFYSKKEKQSDIVQDKSVYTIIGIDTEMEGIINSNGIIKVDGKYKGDICTKSDIIIGENGQVIGNIKANMISIAGKVEGNIIAYKLLEIEATGSLIGDILVKNICIQEGALFKGRSTMLTEVEDVGTEVDTGMLNETKLEEEEGSYLLE